MKKLIWVCALTLSALGGLLGPAACRAQQCPWLNAATAGGFLGGEVKMTVTPLVLNGDATCEFALTHSSGMSTLRITVSTMSRPPLEYSAFVAQCDGLKTPLRAIGNEAIYCAANRSPGKEQIVGRVRDRAFLITITTASAGPGMNNRSGPTEEAVSLAQQVAGALF